MYRYWFCQDSLIMLIADVFASSFGILLMCQSRSYWLSACKPSWV